MRFHKIHSSNLVNVFKLNCVLNLYRDEFEGQATLLRWQELSISACIDSCNCISYFAFRLIRCDDCDCSYESELEVEVECGFTL